MNIKEIAYAIWAVIGLFVLAFIVGLSLGALNQLIKHGIGA